MKNQSLLLRGRTVRTLGSHRRRGTATPRCHRGAQHQLPRRAGVAGGERAGPAGPGRASGARGWPRPLPPPRRSPAAVEAGQGAPGLQEQHPRPPAALRPCGRSAEEWGRRGTNTAQKQLSPAAESPLPRQAPSRGRPAAPRPERGAPSVAPAAGGEGQGPGGERLPRPLARPPGTPARPAGPAAAASRPPGAAHLGGHGAAGAGCAAALPSLALSLPLSVPRLLGRSGWCVRPARSRRWAAQAAPPQRPRPPPPPGGRCAAQQPRAGAGQAGADVAAMLPPRPPFPPGRLGTRGSGGAVCPQPFRQGRGREAPAALR